MHREAPPHILIVDDKQSAHDTLESLLLRDGYRLSFTFSGPEALEKIDDLLPDVVLLDVMMPGMDGFEVCSRLKSHPARRHLPVILVTALDTTEDLARGFEAGADDFLQKPLNGVELRARVRSMLRIKTQYDELQAALRLRRDLSGILVNDIRGPLSRILALSEVLILHAPPGEAPREETSQIRAEVLNLNALLHDMLALTQLEDHQLRLTREHTDINELLVRAVKEAEVLSTSRSISLRVGLPQTPVESEVDEPLVRRVLETLLMHVTRSAPPRNVIDVVLERWSESGQGFRVTITDTGGGSERWRE